MNHDALAFLRSRSSIPSRLLAAPGPTREQLLDMLALAMRVPDHGKLAPWRFLLIEGDARIALGHELHARKLELEPDASSDSLAKEQARFSGAPCVVAVIASITANHKIPEREQLLSAGAVAFQLLLVAHAQGWGAQWLTAWAAYDPVLMQKLGLAAHESVVAFIHLGTPSQPAAERPRPKIAEKFSLWQPLPPIPPPAQD